MSAPPPTFPSGPGDTDGRPGVRLARRSGGPAFIPPDLSRALADVDTHAMPRRASHPSRPTQPPASDAPDPWIAESPTVRVDSAPIGSGDARARQRRAIPRVHAQGRAAPPISQPVARPAAHGASRRVPPWLARVALVVAVLAVALRAGLASASFMAPGGDIAGWSRLPVARCSLCQPSTTAGHAAQPAQARPPTPAEYAATLADRLSLDDALDQMMMVQFTGLEPTPDVIQMVNQQGAGGVLFFGGNIATADQIRATTTQLRRIAPVPIGALSTRTVGLSAIHGSGASDAGGCVGREGCETRRGMACVSTSASARERSGGMKAGPPERRARRTPGRPSAAPGPGLDGNEGGGVLMGVPLSSG